MLTAAIWYMCEQRAPSAPFLLDLDIGDQPTLANLERALKDKYADYRTKMDGSESRLAHSEIVVRREKYYGDLRVALVKDDDFYLFVGLSEADKGIAGQFHD